MTELFYDIYDGEMTFDITECERNADSFELVLKAKYQGKTVGFQMKIPVITRRSLFKTFTVFDYSTPIEFSSIGPQSDEFIIAIEQLLKPAYKSSGKFSEEIETLDFSVLNREMYDINADKIYFKIYNGEDQTDYDEDERINLEMNFSFNLSSNRASLVEVRDGYSADLVAVLMK